MQDLIKKHSEFISYPISLWVENTTEKEVDDDDEEESSAPKEEEEEGKIEEVACSSPMPSLENSCMHQSFRGSITMRIHALARSSRKQSKSERLAGCIWGQPAGELFLIEEFQSCHIHYNVPMIYYYVHLWQGVYSCSGGFAAACCQWLQNCKQHCPFTVRVTEDRQHLSAGASIKHLAP